MNKIRLLLVPALMLAAFVMAPAPAPAATCEYGGRTGNDGGPCMQFNNGSGSSFDLWCLQGYTPSTHKIIMTSADSFTCNVQHTHRPVARTNHKNVWEEHYWSCTNLYNSTTNSTGSSRVKNKIKMNRNLDWEYGCER